jgi:hypothetical protein
VLVQKMVPVVSCTPRSLCVLSTCSAKLYSLHNNIVECFAAVYMLVAAANSIRHCLLILVCYAAVMQSVLSC